MLTRHRNGGMRLLHSLNCVCNACEISLLQAVCLFFIYMTHANQRLAHYSDRILYSTLNVLILVVAGIVVHKCKQAVREAATICPRPLQVDVWPLTFWPWKWCPSHVWRGLALCANFSLPKPLCSQLRSDVRDRQTDRQTDDVRQASDANQCLMPPTLGAGHNKLRIRAERGSPPNLKWDRAPV